MGAPGLRWTLLLLGVLFLAGLFWWELRRPRRARGSDPRRPERPRHEESAPSAQLAHGLRREPVLTLPPMGARDPLLELPTIEVQAGPSADFGLDAAVQARPVLPSGAASGPTCGATSGTPLEAPHELASEGLPSGAASSGPPDPLLEPPPIPVLGPLEEPAEPIVEWPQEGARQIVALRLVAAVDRFPGYVVRQALDAEGFVLGRLSIFHRAGVDGRAVVSAASLNPPGSFDPESIDRQRLGGLSLFAVLPGPLPAARAFDELLASARNLNDRLQGQLQDEQGVPLTPLRAAEMREGLLMRSGHEG